MATEVEAVTGLVATVKFALVAPAGTVTIAGTMATAVLLLESASAVPPAGAAVFRVTVPVEGVPPVTLVGSRLREERVTAGIKVSVSRADLVASSKAAVITTAVELGFELVDTAKFALVAPAGTVTLAGTVAIEGCLLESATVTPPAGAAVISATVPVKLVPAVTTVGLRLRETSGECWNRPVGLQIAPPSLLLNMPIAVTAYKVFGVKGSIVGVPTAEPTP